MEINLDNAKQNNYFMCKNGKILEFSERTNSNETSRYTLYLVNTKYRARLFYNKHGNLNTSNRNWDIIAPLDKNQHPEYFL